MNVFIYVFDLAGAFLFGVMVGAALMMKKDGGRK